MCDNSATDGNNCANKPDLTEFLRWDSHELRVAKARGKLGHLFRVVLVIIKIYRSAVSTSVLIRKYHGINDDKLPASKTDKPNALKLESDLQKAEDKTIMYYFDASKFKPHGKMKELPEECTKALRLAFSLRSEHQISQIYNGLKQVPQFVEFPSSILMKIASRVWMDSFPAHRVIVRQGHRGENYYIIIKGRIEVSIIEVDPITKEIKPRTVNILSKGQAFGEKALLNNVKRNATCVSVDPVDLLVLSKDAFMEIVTMQKTTGGSKQQQHRRTSRVKGHIMEEPEHIQFLRKVPFLHTWPVGKLSTDFESCQFYYYRRGMLICPNINTTDQIFIIKDGSCSVLLMLSDVAKPKIAAYQEMTPLIRTAKDAGKTSLKLPCLYRGLTGQNRRPASSLTDTISASKGSNRCNSNQPSPKGENSEPKLDKCVRQNVFVCIDILVRGDEFGLCTLGEKKEEAGEAEGDEELEIFRVKKKLPDLALVSNGCECVSISKHTLLKHASTLTFKLMKENVRVYPDLEFLKSKFEDSQTWEQYRKSILADCLLNRKKNHLTKVRLASA